MKVCKRGNTVTVTLLCLKIFPFIISASSESEGEDGYDISTQFDDVTEESDDVEPVNADMELALERSLQRRLPPKEKSQEQVVFSCFLPSLGLFGGHGCISAATVTLGLWAASASFFSVSADFPATCFPYDK